jgi:universal stress protein E
MKRFQNILFVSHGLENEAECLKEALALACNKQANFKVLIAHPGLPHGFDKYQGTYEKALLDNTKLCLKTAAEAMPEDIRPDPEKIPVEIEGGDMQAVRIIRRAIADDCDLLIKPAENREGNRGYEALDMELLRKSPVPVWLARETGGKTGAFHIAVAVDPLSDEKAGRDLGLELLDLAAALNSEIGNRLSIVSCWDYPLEDSLRNNVFVRVPEEEIKKTLEIEKAAHLDTLNGLIAESGIGEAGDIHHLHGKPQNVIPKFVDENGVDLLVMGTVARTGIPGFVMGNTAENILQKVSSSLLAMKPPGFVSPVKP